VKKFKINKIEIECVYLEMNIRYENRRLHMNRKRHMGIPTVRWKKPVELYNSEFYAACEEERKTSPSCLPGKRNIRRKSAWCCLFVSPESFIAKIKEHL
jgi:hypothetical protein